MVPFTNALPLTLSVFCGFVFAIPNLTLEESQCKFVWAVMADVSFPTKSLLTASVDAPVPPLLTARVENCGSLPSRAVWRPVTSAIACTCEDAAFPLSCVCTLLVASRYPSVVVDIVDAATLPLLFDTRTISLVKLSDTIVVAPPVIVACFPDVIVYISDTFPYRPETFA